MPTASPLTESRAVALVLQTDPRFTGLPRRDPGAIGQGSWYEVARSASGYTITVHIGWGDCPSGCIHGHTWTFSVDARGRVTLVGESGDPLETAAPGVTGFVTAAPTCPVERNPPDPACAPRPVSGAVLVVRRADGSVIARATTARDGSYRLDLAPGLYLLVPQPVTGLIGTPQPVGFRVPDGASDPVRIDIQYDTGIR